MNKPGARIIRESLKGCVLLIIFTLALAGLAAAIAVYFYMFLVSAGVI